VAKKELKNGGEFNLLQCDLILADGVLHNLTAAIIGLTIFENIGQFTITGTISIQDSYNLASLGPIIGQEYLRLKIATPNLSGGENTIDFTKNPLMIIAVDDRENVGNGVQVTTMSFCSREFILNQQARVRRTLVGSYSEIVQMMLKTDLDSDKAMNIQPSADNKKINAPNIKPLDVISIATNKAISRKYNDATYFFWESTSGFNFKTLGDMYSEEPVMTYESTVAGTRTKNGVKDIMAELGTIEAYTITSSPDTVYNYAAGIFSSELLVHDVISKSYKKHTYKYSDNFFKEQHLGPTPLAITDPDGKSVSSHPSAQYLKPTVGIGGDQGFEDEYYQYTYSGNELNTLQSRRSQLAMLNSGLQLSINVVGTTIVKAGDIVKIIIPSVAAYQTTKNEPEDMLYNGKFLVKNLRHDFLIGENKHTMSMNVTKDAMGKLT